MRRIVQFMPKEPIRKLAENTALPHVLLVLDQFPKTLGGGERIALQIASLLPQYGFHASILTFSIHPDCFALTPPQCPVYLLPLQRTYDLAALQSAFDLGTFIREQEIQIVQTFFESSDLWAGAVTKTMSDSKLIWSQRDMGILRGRKHRLGYRLLSRLPDAVFSVSEQVRRHSIEVDRVVPVRVQTIYNGVDLCGWNDALIPQNTSRNIVITTVGNIRRVKGHDVFIRAAALIAPQYPKVTFSVGGEILEPKYFEELQALVHDLGLSDRFRFIGGVTDLRQHLSTADIFVLPSRSEGFSNAIIEAMAASLPVVASNVGGNSEAVEDGVSGILVPSEDPAKLAVAILRLLANPGQARAMGAAGRSIVAERFTIEAMMKRIASAYKDLLYTK